MIYTASSRLNIEKGESLVMLIDGERVAFAALDSADSRTDQGYGSSYGKILEIEQSLRHAEPVQVASNDDSAVLYATDYGRSYRHNYYGRSYRHNYNYGHGYGYHSYSRHYNRSNYYRPYYYQPYSYYVPYSYNTHYYSSPYLGRHYGHYGYQNYSYPSHGHGAYQNSTHENEIYPISLDDLRKIAFANEVKIRVVGRYYVQRHFTSKNFKIFQRFIEETTVRHSQEFSVLD